VNIFINKHTYIHMYIYTHIYICMYMHMQIFLYMYLSIYNYMYIIHVSDFVYAYIWICVRIYIHVYEYYIVMYSRAFGRGRLDSIHINCRFDDSLTLQHTATRCNALHHTTTHCNTLRHSASTIHTWIWWYQYHTLRPNVSKNVPKQWIVYWNLLQHDYAHV